MASRIAGEGGGIDRLENAVAEWQRFIASVPRSTINLRATAEAMKVDHGAKVTFAGAMR